MVLTVCLTPTAWAAGSVEPADRGAAAETAGQLLRGLGDDTCGQMAPAVWPTTTVARRAHIARLQLARAKCMDSPTFLGLLGALLLDDGEPAQALIWLERSLLLDPGNLGAQADHAIALSELGEPEALREMVRDWTGRNDIPAALRAKVFPADPRSAFALPTVRLGQPERVLWGVQGEASLSVGYENNLDRSPRLTELTLTVPDGPLVLPVISQPRTGAAAFATLTTQVAYAPGGGTVLRSGLNLMARSSPTDSTTDWQQIQWASSASHQWSGWRGQLEGGAIWSRGPLGEPYRLTRLGLAGETAVVDCRARAAIEGEQRVQEMTRGFDSVSNGWLVSLQCPLPAAPSWALSLALRVGDDKPDSTERPGGSQKLSAVGMRLTGSLGYETRVDLSLRSSTVRDELGYSPLLENNAARKLSLRQFSAELGIPLRPLGLPGVEATFQWQTAKQNSNLQLFSYRADSFYAGLRWVW